MREDFPEELAPNTSVTGAKVTGPVSVQDLNCFRCRDVNIAIRIVAMAREDLESGLC